MKKLGLLITIMFTVSQLNAQNTLIGKWEGGITVPGGHLKIVFKIDGTAEKPTGTLDIPQQGAIGLRFESIIQKEDSVRLVFSAGQIKGIFSGVFDSDSSISGKYSQGGGKTPFSVERALSEEPEKVQNEIDIVLLNGEIEIGGTLTLPEGEIKAPLLVMSSGSGAQDRDETIVGFKPFQIIAEHLSKNGIPSFRYDDRGIGKSSGIFNEATLDVLASDVEAIIHYFKSKSDIKFDEFTLLGHSQGGMVAAKVASQNKDIVKVILMASPTVPLKDVISEQIVVMQKAMGKTDEDLVQTLEFQEKAYEATRTDKGWQELEVYFKELVKTEIAKLPEAQQALITDIDAFSKAQFEQSVSPIRTPQMRSLMFYDAGEDLSQLNIPILGLFGEKDTQVTDKQNASRFKEICSGREEHCTTIVYENANHLFQHAETGLPMEYATLPKEFIDGFLKSISEWVLKN